MDKRNLEHLRDLNMYNHCPRCGRPIGGNEHFLCCNACLTENVGSEEPKPCKFCVVCGTEKPVEYSGSLSDILCMFHSALIIQSFEREREVFRTVRSQVLVRDMTRVCNGTIAKGSDGHNEVLKRIYEDATLLDNSYVGAYTKGAR